MTCSKKVCKGQKKKNLQLYLKRYYTDFSMFCVSLHKKGSKKGCFNILQCLKCFKT